MQDGVDALNNLAHPFLTALRESLGLAHEIHLQGITQEYMQFLFTENRHRQAAAQSNNVINSMHITAADSQMQVFNNNINCSHA